jgi:hypothetical protein
MEARLLLYLTTVLCLTGCGRSDLRKQNQAWREERERRDTEAAQYDAHVAAVRRSIIARYDRNSDGILNSSEKQACDEYMQQIKNGRVANPFVTTEQQ